MDIYTWVCLSDHVHVARAVRGFAWCTCAAVSYHHVFGPDLTRMAWEPCAGRRSIVAAQTEVLEMRREGKDMLADGAGSTPKVAKKVWRGAQRCLLHGACARSAQSCANTCLKKVQGKQSGGKAQQNDVRSGAEENNHHEEVM